ncbi:hypothetical protein H9P43_007694 [Blastocladiella emersonii ATCC 22665]|nr:hypothetical protein H9P43_007694 [Blastocladiella emersonii ATCC 22665]
MLSDSDYENDTTSFTGAGDDASVGGTLAYFSRELLKREEAYRLRDVELAKKATSVLAETESAVREGMQLLERTETMPVSKFLSLGLDDDDDTDAQGGGAELEFESKPASSSRPTSGSTKRAGLKPASGRRPATAGAATKPASATAPATRSLPAAELNLIQKIADKLQEATEDPSHDYTLEATNRYLKARLLVVEDELERAAKDARDKTKAQTAAEAALKTLDDAHKKLAKQHQTLQTAHDKTAADLAACEQRAAAAENARAHAVRELAAIKKSERVSSSDAQNKDKRLNRALEEVDRLRQAAAKADADRKEQVDTLKKANDRLATEIKRLEKQKGELLVGFKKQSALIDVLRKQKMHLEAAKLLSFTEEEFTKLLDWY